MQANRLLSMHCSCFLASAVRRIMYAKELPKLSSKVHLSSICAIKKSTTFSSNMILMNQKSLLCGAKFLKKVRLVRSSMILRQRSHLLVNSAICLLIFTDNMNINPYFVPMNIFISLTHSAFRRDWFTHILLPIKHYERQLMLWKIFLCSNDNSANKKNLNVFNSKKLKTSIHARMKMKKFAMNFVFEKVPSV